MKIVVSIMVSLFVFVFFFVVVVVCFFSVYSVVEAKQVWYFFFFGDAQKSVNEDLSPLIKD